MGLETLSKINNKFGGGDYSVLESNLSENPIMIQILLKVIQSAFFDCFYVKGIFNKELH